MFPSNETGDDDAEVVVIPGGRVEVLPLLGGGRAGFIHKPLSKLALLSSSIPFSPISAARTRGVTSPPTRISQLYGTCPDEQIHITGFVVGAEQLFLANSLPVRVGSEHKSLESNKKSKTSASSTQSDTRVEFFLISL